MDRRVAGLAFLLACVTMVPANVFGGEAAPSATSSLGAEPTTDVQARRELLDAFRQGAARSWRVEWTFRRTLADGRTIGGAVVEANRPPDHLTSSFGTVSGERRGRSVTCSTTEKGLVCDTPHDIKSGQRARGLDDLRVLTHPDLAWYTVARAPSREIAGQHARCYRVSITKKSKASPYGRHSEYCFGRGGIPLRTVEQRVDATDVRNATRVTREISDADVAALLKPFVEDPQATAPVAGGVEPIVGSSTTTSTP